MLTIRPEQLQALQSAMIDRFRQRAIRAAASMAAFPRAEIVSLVDTAMLRAPEYGIDAEDDVLAYLGLMIRHGADFDRRSPRAAEILAEERWTGTRKIRALQAELAGARDV